MCTARRWGKGAGGALVVLGVAIAGLPAPAWARYFQVTPSGLEGSSPLATSPTWADLNQDGYPDLLTTNGIPVEPDHSHALFSTGSQPPYADVSASLAAGMYSRLSGWTAQLTGDLNGDGLPDVVRAGFESVGDTGVVEVYLNRGNSSSFPYSLGDESLNPNWSVSGTEADLSPSGLLILDFNGDGWPDLVVVDDGFRFYQNDADGTGHFQEVVLGEMGLPPAGTVASGPPTIVDVNGDGRLDLLVPTTGGPDLWLAQADGTFAGSRAPDFDANAGYLVCDFDSDGDADLFPFGTTTDESGAGTADQIFANDGAGVFTAQGVPTPLVDGILDAACGDVDNDGDVDLAVFANVATHVLLNDGAQPPAFVLDSEIPTETGTEMLSGDLIDYDNDGDLDLMLGRANQNELWHNDVDGSSYLHVRVLHDVSACDEAPRYRAAPGSRVILRNATGTLLGSRDAISGQRRGGTSYDVLHFGLPDGQDATYQVEIHLADAGEPPASGQTIPASLPPGHLLSVHVPKDADADRISSAAEMADGRALADPNDDVDGDRIPNWLDPDADGDGVPDSVEAGDADLCTPAIDSDDSGVPDYLEASVLYQPFLEGSGCACTQSGPNRSPGGAAWPTALAGLALLIAVRRRRRR